MAFVLPFSSFAEVQSVSKKLHQENLETLDSFDCDPKDVVALKSKLAQYGFQPGNTINDLWSVDAGRFTWFNDYNISKRAFQFALAANRVLAAQCSPAALTECMSNPINRVAVTYRTHSPLKYYGPIREMGIALSIEDTDDDNIGDSAEGIHFPESAKNVDYSYDLDEVFTCLEEFSIPDSELRTWSENRIRLKQVVDKIVPTSKALQDAGPGYTLSTITATEYVLGAYTWSGFTQLVDAFSLNPAMDNDAFVSDFNERFTEISDQHFHVTIAFPKALREIATEYSQ
jgi:hypothetical protein